MPKTISIEKMMINSFFRFSKNRTLNKIWSIPSWISLKASRARFLAGTSSMLASMIFLNSSSISGNLTGRDAIAAAAFSLLCLLHPFPWNQSHPNTQNIYIIKCKRCLFLFFYRKGKREKKKA